MVRALNRPGMAIILLVHKSGLNLERRNPGEEEVGYSRGEKVLKVNKLNNVNLMP